MTTELRSIGIIALNGSNYPTWKLQCRMALTRDGVWSIVNGSEKPPEDGDVSVLAKFDSRRDKALATIVLSMDPSLLYLLGADPVDPVLVWKKLSEQFQKRTWANKLVLRRRLHSLRLKEGDSVQEHIKAMTEIFNELAVVGEEISEEDRVVYLLASLPDSFNTLVTALEANAEVPKMEIVTERLLNEERKRETIANGQEGAMTARSRPPKWRSSVKCFRCHKIGHIQRNCPERSQQFPDTGRSRQSSIDTTPKTKPSSKPFKSKAGSKQVINQIEVLDAVTSDSEGDSDVGLVTSHVLATNTGRSGPKMDYWIVDSGATCHICNDDKMFVNRETLQDTQTVVLGNGHHLAAMASGVVELQLVSPDGVMKTYQLHDVLYVPDLCYNLMSVSKLTETGRKVKFLDTRCLILNQEERVIGLATKKGNLYYLKSNHPHHELIYSAEEQHGSVWHRRFGHLNNKYLEQFSRENLVKGFKYQHATSPTEVCESCVQGKLHKTKFPKTERSRAKMPLELVHSDVCGKLNCKSLSGAEYFLTFVDDKTHYTWVYVLKKKSDVFEKFKEWKVMVERESECQLKILRTDNGGEYTSTQFEQYLKAEGVRHELTIPKTPEQNGVAERMNRTLTESIRSMLIDARLPQRFWAEALSTAVYLRNRSPTKAVAGMTPFEAWKGHKPNVDYLRVFGCTVYAHVEKEERGKLDSKARKCVLLGYGTRTKGYRLYDVDRKRVFHSRNVSIEEEKMGFIEIVEQPKPNHMFVELETSETDHDEDSESVPVNTSHDVREELSVRRPQRERRRPDYYGVWVNSAEILNKEPTSVEEALTNSEKQSWKAAMKREMESICSNDVWDLVELPNQRKAIGCKWVFKRKIGPDGSIERYKARLVAQGFSQQHGSDYDETFSPVARFESLRTLIAHSVQNDLSLHQLDFTSAFLNGKLEEEVFMRQPKGFVEKGKEHLVCKLKHSLYGLKQASRCWNSILHDQLTQMGFKQSNGDPCIYTRSEGEEFIIGVYVDDIILAAKDLELIQQVKDGLARKFDIKDLGELNYFLGVNIQMNHKNGTIWIGQPTYTKNMLQKFEMNEAKPVGTPVDSGTKLNKANEDSELINTSLYQSAVGSLLYLATKTRHDITYAVNNVARFCANPSKQHWTAVKRIFRYLRGTIDHGLLYEKTKGPTKLVGFSDADWGGDTEDFKSTSGYCFEIGGTLITWKSKKQACVALSTAEAEYMALSSAAQEAVWLRELTNDLKDGVLNSPTVVFEDNQAAIKMAKNPQYHGRAKHISIKYHYIREQVANCQIELKYCRTDEMIADMFTKGLSKAKLIKLREMAGVKELPVYE